MARMHSRAKGKSGSKKPIKKSSPVWSRYKSNEIELLITKLAKEGKTASQIGMLLRDSYGIPDIKTVTKKKITKILEEKGLVKEFPDDLMALIKKAFIIRKHMEENKHDYTGLRGLQLTESKINRLTKYYKKQNRLAKDWKYDPAKIRLYIE